VIVLIRLAPRCGGASVVSSARAKHTLPDLPYDYNALEPVISADILQVAVLTPGRFMSQSGF